MPRIDRPLPRTMGEEKRRLMWGSDKNSRSYYVHVRGTLLERKKRSSFFGDMFRFDTVATCAQSIHSKLVRRSSLDKALFNAHAAKNAGDNDHAAIICQKTIT